MFNTTKFSLRAGSLSVLIICVSEVSWREERGEEKLTCANNQPILLMQIINTLSEPARRLSKVVFNNVV